MTFKQRLVPGGINEINTNHVIITTTKKNPIIITKGKA